MQAAIDETMATWLLIDCELIANWLQAAIDEAMAGAASVDVGLINAGEIEQGFDGERGKR